MDPYKHVKNYSFMENQTPGVIPTRQGGLGQNSMYDTLFRTPLQVVSFQVLNNSETII